jgi:hypothetical protein
MYVSLFISTVLAKIYLIQPAPAQSKTAPNPCTTSPASEANHSTFLPNRWVGLAAATFSVVSARTKEYTPVPLTTISMPHRGNSFMDWCTVWSQDRRCKYVLPCSLNAPLISRTQARSQAAQSFLAQLAALSQSLTTMLLPPRLTSLCKPTSHCLAPSFNLQPGQRQILERRRPRSFRDVRLLLPLATHNQPRRCRIATRRQDARAGK